MKHKLYNVLIPNYNVGFMVTGTSSYRTRNLLVNEKLFAGVDVTEAYWNEH